MESLTKAVSPAIHRLHLATFKLAGQFNPPTFEDTRADLFGYLVVSGAGRAEAIISSSRRRKYSCRPRSFSSPAN